MFNEPLLTVNPLEMMKLWGELVECYHDVNGYGSNTAEIYAYRLQGYDPFIHSNLESGGDTRIERIKEINYTAASALASLCGQFSKHYDCRITIDNLPMRKWLMTQGEHFEHRAHVKVIRS